MPSNKDRLYIALYARGGASTMPGGEDTYHWALLAGPKIEDQQSQGMRYHAKERIRAPGQMEWVFEEREVSVMSTSALLARIMIGKVEKIDRLVQILRNTPIRQGDAGWNCVLWVKEAIQTLHDDGKALGTSQTDWQVVRDSAMWYVEKKKAEHRFDGLGNFDMSRAPTYDLLEGKETIV